MKSQPAATTVTAAEKRSQETLASLDRIVNAFNRKKTECSVLHLFAVIGNWVVILQFFRKFVVAIVFLIVDQICDGILRPVKFFTGGIYGGIYLLEIKTNVFRTISLGCIYFTGT